MRIEFSVEGGFANFPGLSKPVAVDADGQLQRLVAASRFFDLPTDACAPARGAADYQTNVLTVDDGTRRHTVRICEPIAEPALEELVNAVRKHVKAIRAAKR
jgi:hypothetical protein